ncbi:MAG: TetR/AcrR family transcriptional regulator [Rhodocyclales bacterium]|nr:TetR/AcrR family transcriptional regulator [Rhodocyclales bacterium]
MRYSKEHKDEARQRLLDASARHVKKHGFAASGVDALASAAGVTSGSLYKHFGGKSDLFASVIRTELKRTAERFAEIRPGDNDAAEKAIAAYLSVQHVRHPERGCLLPGLTAEVARADDAVRAAFDGGLREVHKQLEPIAGSSANAWALIARNVGAVMLARAALDPGLQRELLDSALAEARSLFTDGSIDR